MNMRAFIVAVAFAALAAPASAQTGLYLGAGAGVGFLPFDDDFLQVSGATASTVTTEEGSFGYKAFIGYRFHPNIAIEGGYMNFGDFEFTRNVTSPFGGTAQADLEVSGWNIDVLGILPLPRNWTLFVKAGALYSTTKTTYSATGAVTFAPGTNLNPQVSEWNFKIGFGGQYDFHQNLGVRIEVETAFDVGNSQTGEGNVTLVSGSLLFRF